MRTEKEERGARDETMEERKRENTKH